MESLSPSGTRIEVNAAPAQVFLDEEKVAVTAHKEVGFVEL